MFKDIVSNNNAVIAASCRVMCSVRVMPSCAVKEAFFDDMAK
jgi:hypothetical protein